MKSNLFKWAIIFCVSVWGCTSKPDLSLPDQSIPKEPVVSEPAAEIKVPALEAETTNTSHLGPLEAIQDLDKKIESYELGEALTPEQIENNQKLKAKIIRGTFDIKELCRLALAKHWDEITNEQRLNVVELMTRLLEKKALFSKERLSGKDKYYDIQYLNYEISPEDKAQSLVKTKLKVPKRELVVDIQYKMILTPLGWKIFDVIVDDSSMLINYKSAFHNIITKYGFGELEKRMQQKLEDIK